MKYVEKIGVYRHRKLYGELRALIPAGDVSLSGGHQIYETDGTVSEGVLVGVPDEADTAAVEAVITAHDPTTPGPAETREELERQNELALRERVVQAIDTLEQAWAAWPNLAAAQKDAAARLNVRVTVALARLQLRKLDRAD